MEYKYIRKSEGEREREERRRVSELALPCECGGQPPRTLHVGHGGADVT